MNLERNGAAAVLHAHVRSSSSQGDSVSSKGEELRLSAPLDKINLHLREGSVIPTQVEIILK